MEKYISEKSSLLQFEKKSVKKVLGIFWKLSV